MPEDFTSPDSASHIQHRRLKAFARNTLSALNLNLTYAFSPGLSFFGLNIFRDPRPGPIKYRALYALDHVLKRQPKAVLDVGSGGGEHARRFRESGSRVVCIDLGTSVYARSRTEDGIEIVNADFNRYESEERFDLVWASHVLEHQRNAGEFISRLIENCAPGGWVCITVPDPHRGLWGGHVSLWTPGLLAYNTVLCGVDLSDAEFVRGSNEFSLIFQPHKIDLPKLSYDYGDLDLLAPYLPGMKENSDPWKVGYRNV